MTRFNCQQCGGCCGPVPLTKQELAQIKAEISAIPQETIDKIKKQQRDSITCILLDAESKRCLVYNSRPLVCCQYGQIRELECPNNTGLKLKSGRKETMQVSRYDIAGILSVNIGWRELEGVK